MIRCNAKAAKTQRKIILISVETGLVWCAMRTVASHIIPFRIDGPRDTHCVSTMTTRIDRII